MNQSTLNGGSKSGIVVALYLDLIPNLNGISMSGLEEIKTKQSNNSAAEELN